MRPLRVPGECSEGFFSPSGTRPGTQRENREAQYFGPLAVGPWVPALARKERASAGTREPQHEIRDR